MEDLNMEKLNAEQVEERIIREVRCGRELTIADAERSLMWAKINDIIEWIKEHQESTSLIAEQVETLNDLTYEKIKEKKKEK